MKKILQPNEAIGKWSIQEHQIFLEGLKNFGKNWKLISDRIKSRNPAQVRSHGQKHFQKSLKSPLQFSHHIQEFSHCEISTQYGEDMSFPLS